jgi:3,4-dihydroxy 2-butanone 4-phosphate synthase
MTAQQKDVIPASEFDSIPDTIASFRNGNFVVVLDDPSRENEADLIIAAESVSTAQMAFLIRHSSGYVCAPLAPALADAWALPPMVAANEDPRGTAYTVTVDAADPSVSTGISARDRALTCRVLAGGPPLAVNGKEEKEAQSEQEQDQEARKGQTPADAVHPEGLRRPGHVLPLRARPGGVRQRPGHTEAAVDLCRLAGKQPAAVICEIVDDGIEVSGQAVREESGMLRGDACIAFARRWGLKVCTIADLVAHLEKTDGGL